MKYYLLTGDIGGTNSRMAFYDTHSSKCTPIYEKHYRNSEHILPEYYNDPCIFTNQIIIPFLKYCFEEMTKEESASTENDVQIIATLAVAGMVLNNQVRLTNLGNILIDGNAIAKDNKNEYLRKIIICRIINDFVAVRIRFLYFFTLVNEIYQSLITHHVDCPSLDIFYLRLFDCTQQGYGCLTLQQNEVRSLYGPCPNVEQLPIGPKVCIGAGTGLGECYLTPDQTNDDTQTVTYSCFASEGGHVEYAPRNDIEIEMYQFLMEKFSSKHRISVERVVSGKGLANVYDFLSHKFPSRINPTIHAEFIAAGDEQGRVVAQNASNCTLCQEAISIMISAYGCETGSVAIKFIPTGGLFVTGGLTPKNIKYIEGLHTDFMMSYLNKGRVSPLLQHVPLFAVMVEDLGVRGAHKAAYTEYESHIRTSEDGSNVQRQKRFNDQWFIGTIVAISLAFGTLTLLRRK